MILAFEARDNRSVLLQFEGGLTYVHYERMVGLIMDSNL